MNIKYKILILIILACLGLCMFTNNVNADVQINPEREYNQVEIAVDDFIFYLDMGSSNIYSVIDSTKTELYQGILEYIYEDIEIDYEVKNIEKIDDNTYKVKGKIKASGENWNANGFTVIFEVEKKYGGSYKVIYTDLFDKIGAENVAKTSLLIVGTIFLIFVFGGLLLLGIIIMIVVIIVVINKKKKKEQNKQQN